MKNETIKKLVAVTVMSVLAFGCVTPEQVAYTQDEMDKFMWLLNYECEDTGITLKSRVFVPSTTGKYDMILFLHGAGQKGTDNKSHLYENDIGRLTYYSDKNNKHVIMVPQCPPDKEWTDPDMIETLDSYIDFVARKIYVCNTENITVTGFSMGGIGTFKVVMHNPDRYCGMMPVCGGPRSWWEKERPDIPDEMKGISIWAYNNVNDNVVDNLYSKYVVSQMWYDENSDAHYTEQYNGHCDEYVFADKNALNWLLTRKRKTDGKR